MKHAIAAKNIGLSEGYKARLQVSQEPLIPMAIAPKLHNTRATE